MHRSTFPAGAASFLALTDARHTLSLRVRKGVADCASVAWVLPSPLDGLRKRVPGAYSAKRELFWFMRQDQNVSGLVRFRAISGSQERRIGGHIVEFYNVKDGSA